VVSLHAMIVYAKVQKDMHMTAMAARRPASKAATARSAGGEAITAAATEPGTLRELHRQEQQHSDGAHCTHYDAGGAMLAEDVRVGDPGVWVGGSELTNGRASPVPSQCRPTVSVQNRDTRKGTD
jgi:hypothetical protein